MILQHDPIPSLPWWAKILITALVGGIVTLGTERFASNHNEQVDDHRLINERIVTLEHRQVSQDTQVKDDHEHLVHVESQVDKLVEWALGHK